MVLVNCCTVPCVWDGAGVSVCVSRTYFFKGVAKRDCTERILAYIWTYRNAVAERRPPQGCGAGRWPGAPGPGMRFPNGGVRGQR
mgnify:FL=1